MKINEPRRISSMKSAYGNAPGTGAGSAGSVKRKDNVSISSEAMELLQSQKLTGAERQKKIEELKGAVSSGTYYIDSGRIADKLLPFFK